MPRPEGWKDTEKCTWRNMVLAARLLEEGVSATDVAETLQIDRRTLYRWMDKEEWEVAVLDALNDWHVKMTRNARKQAMAVLNGEMPKVPSTQVQMIKFFLERGNDPRFRPPPKAKEDAKVPVVFGKVPAGAMRDPDEETTLPDGINENPNLLFPQVALPDDN